MNIFSSDFEEDSSTNRHTPTDFEVEDIKSDPESLAFGLFTTLTAYEDHYDLIQTKYKALAITWVIAAFIGIGYLLSGYEKALHINPLLIIFFLSLLAAQGVFLLWFLDAAVYGASINAIFEEVCKIEIKYPEVGKTHHIIDKYFEEKDKDAIFHDVFYASFILFLLLIGVGSLGFYLYFIQKWIATITVVLFILIIITIYYFVRKAPFRKKAE